MSQDASEKHEFILALVAHIIAFVVVIGGGSLLFLTRGEASSHDLQVIVAGFIGSALTWEFGGVTSARASRQAERSYAAGVAVPTVPAVNRISRSK